MYVLVFLDIVFDVFVDYGYVYCCVVDCYVYCVMVVFVVFVVFVVIVVIYIQDKVVSDFDFVVCWVCDGGQFVGQGCGVGDQCVVDVEGQ